jgi:16S rRNA (adenine1518-N6/adenine1519-N6)-dimethyltransferase
MLQLHGSLTRILNLPPGAFSPPPKVDSSVIRLAFGPAPVRIPDLRLFERVVKQAFQQRRKTVANTLKGLVPTPAEVLVEAGLDPRRRPETLTLEELARLTEKVAGTLRRPVL